MTREDCVILGYISKAHGLKGEVKFAYDVQEIQDYLDVRTIYLAKKNMPLEKVRISRLNPHANKQGILKIVGVNARGEAEALVGSEVWFPVERLPKLEEGQVFYFEIIGFGVSDKAKGPIGKIRDIYETGAEDLLVVDNPDGKEILIPFQKPIYLHTDRDTETVHVDLPDGLLELYVE
jgi:16S rRNA processing protein RimM